MGNGTGKFVIPSQTLWGIAHRSIDEESHDDLKKRTKAHIQSASDMHLPDANLSLFADRREVRIHLVYDSEYTKQIRGPRSKHRERIQKRKLATKT